MIKKKLKKLKHLHIIFAGNLMRKGKRPTMERIIDKTLKHVFTKTKNPTSIMFKKYVAQVGSIINVKGVSSRRKVIRVPFALNRDKRNKLVVKSLLNVVRTQKLVDTMPNKLSHQLITALLDRETEVHNYNLSNAKEVYTKRYDTHFRWKF
jgi:ribosomal protein S7